MKYEYKTYSHPMTDRQLNEWGSDGWRLVSHSALVDGQGFARQYYVFIREIAE